MSDLLPDVILPDEPVSHEEPNITAEIRDVDEEPEEEEEDVLVTPEIKPVIEDEYIFKDVEPKPKKPRSKKQLDHLSKIREKALATRRANKAKREAEQEPKKKKEVSFVKEEPKEEKSSLRYLTEEQIVDLQERAVENYDTKRKARKVAKQKKAKEDTHSAKTYEAVAKAIHQPTNPDPDDVWALCFQ
jgi:hypothetical protein